MKKQINEADTDSSNNNKNCKERKLFVGCLPKSLSRACLVHHFSQYGTVSDFEFKVVPQKDGKSKLINAVLTCSSTEMKDSIIRQPNLIEGHKLKIVPYLDPSELQGILSSTRSRKIYIKRLPAEFDNATLKRYFSKYGAVQKAYCVEGTRKRKNLKYGYVIFREEKTLNLLPEKGFPFNDEFITWTSFEKKQENFKKAENEDLIGAGVDSNGSVNGVAIDQKSSGGEREEMREEEENKLSNLQDSKKETPDFRSSDKGNFDKLKKKKKKKKKKRPKKKKLKVKMQIDHDLKPGKIRYHQVFNQFEIGDYHYAEVKFRPMERIGGRTHHYSNGAGSEWIHRSLDTNSSYDHPNGHGPDGALYFSAQLGNAGALDYSSYYNGNRFT